MNALYNNKQTQGKARFFSSFSNYFLNLPLIYILIFSFFIVTLLPLLFLAYNLHAIEWDNAWREIHEKHRLLALNMASPVSIYINDSRSALKQLSDLLISSSIKDSDQDIREQLVRNTTNHIKHFKKLILISPDGHFIAGSKLIYSKAQLQQQILNDATFIATREQRKGLLSGIQASLFDSLPTLLMTEPVIDKSGTLQGILLGELEITLIEKLRKSIHFGKKGHSAIVDQFGRVIAHPHHEWMLSMHDLSHLSVVQAMMAGKTGVIEFYSPFIKQDMVAGYTAVEGIGWGIMVPQPKQEIDSQIRKILFTQFSWAFLGLVMTLLLAIVLAHWINAPLKRLTHSAKQICDNNYTGKLPANFAKAPYEIRELSHNITRLVDGLQDAKAEISTFNAELNSRIHSATEALRISNNRLRDLADKDYLTELSNRRYLERSLDSYLKSAQSDESLSLIMIDVDHFKKVNDTLGHSAGDAILVQLSKVLSNATRVEDILARYAGDEFVIWLRCHPKTATSRANQILETVRNATFEWQDTALDITVSMGVITIPVTQLAGAESLFHQVDQAMYRAKKGGRNRLET